MVDETEGNEEAMEDHDTIFQRSPLQPRSIYKVCLSFNHYKYFKKQLDEIERLNVLLE